MRPEKSTKPHVVLYSLFKITATPTEARGSYSRTKPMVPCNSRCLKWPLCSSHYSGCLRIPRHYANADRCCLCETFMTSSTCLYNDVGVYLSLEEERKNLDPRERPRLHYKIDNNDLKCTLWRSSPLRSRIAPGLMAQ